MATFGLGLEYMYWTYKTLLRDVLVDMDTTIQWCKPNGLLARLRNVMLAVFPCIGKSTIKESMVTGMGGMHARMVHIHACMYEGRSARTILRKKA